jgi:hypothetical protein
MKERTAHALFKQCQLRDGNAIVCCELLGVKACGVSQRPEPFTIAGLPK